MAGHRWSAFLLGSLLALLACRGTAQAPPAAGIIINGVRLTDHEVAMLSAIVRGQVAPGHYWYDRVSGAWGYDGGSVAGIIPAGLPFGGRLRADASQGTTGVFVNGRQLPVVDVLNLQRALQSPIPRGRYWLDANGNYGYEGGPPLGNLVAIARQGNTLTQCYGNGACSSGNSNTHTGVMTDGQGGAMMSTPDGPVFTP